MFLYYIFLVSLTNFVMSDFHNFKNEDDVTVENIVSSETDFIDQDAHFRYPKDDSLSFLDKNICEIYRAEKIDRQDFPEAYQFLVDLVIKYPKEFEHVTFLKVRGTVPFAGCSIIGIPYQWLLELESKIPVALQWAEWALLHEAGHVHHQHVKMLTYLIVAKSIFYQLCVSSLGYCLMMPFISDETIKKQWNAKIEKKDIAYTTIFFLSTALVFEISSIIYSRYVAEAGADDFAAEKCMSKEALQAGAIFLEEVSLDSPLYPSIEDRVSKINNAIKSKFD